MASKSSAKAPVVRQDRATARKAPVRKVKTVVTARMDRKPAAATQLKKVTTAVTTRQDKTEVKVKDLKQVKALIRAAPRRRLDLTPQDFDAFFQAEIDEEVGKPATMHGDRFARWRCQCCDAVLRVPRRTFVLHGDYTLVHDDLEGLLVNGKRWVPGAAGDGPLQIVQPGRLRDPFTGKLIQEGKYAV